MEASLICGNDDDANAKMTAILEDFGWGVVDLSGIECSRYLEPMCMVWLSAMRANTWIQAFRLLSWREDPWPARPTSC